MRNERSIPGSAAEFDYEKSVRKTEDKFVWKYLQINKYLNRPAASVWSRGTRTETPATGSPEPASTTVTSMP